MKDIITKAAQVAGLEVTEAELTLINKHTIKALTAEEVFIFKVAMCDNEIDRDNEVFTRDSLEKFAGLFEGRTMISDHQWKSGNQCARIYETEVLGGTGTTKNGEPYAQLVAHCYMVKTENNKDLITDINAGIKKEVSIGFRIGKAICSICGADNRKTYCEHWAGKIYEGQACYFKLLDPTDAYEVSFVAVPAQPKAGVVKSYGDKEITEDKPEENVNHKNFDIDIKILESFIFTKNKKSREME